MALPALDVRDKAHATCIALLARIIQTLLGRQPRLYGQRRIAHVVPLQNIKTKKVVIQITISGIGARYLNHAMQKQKGGNVTLSGLVGQLPAEYANKEN
jgi:hypothetical protein